MTALDSAAITRWLLDAEAAIAADADRLSALDASLGDGDHGTNMSRGFAAVGAAVREHAHDLPPGPLLALEGRTLISTIGGASGALWGLAFRRAGRALGDDAGVAPSRLADVLDAMVTAVVDLGEAQPGDKTMLDALLPASHALRAGLEAGASPAAAAKAAAAAARSGADATAGMEARRGRASFMGRRSIGHQDPSANSAALIVGALASSLEMPGVRVASWPRRRSLST
jgi:dihydroxyacetone kinase-like protein